NSRFTAPAENCPTIADEFFTGEGVPIDAIVFGGRRAKAEPLVYQSKSWDHGVFVGSAMTSETTAAAKGQVGVVRHDPMAMIPFCGYNMSDYFQHWIDMGKKMTDPPKIFHVNWFRTDEKDEFIWPGFGDNLRVLLWMLARCKGEAEAVETPLGYEPRPEDIDTTDLDLDAEDLKKLLAIDKETWQDEIKGIEEFYSQFDKLPDEINEAFDALKKGVEAL
ncbi:MAG: phosphoenolpyruvate carboxykinase (GTP), partial [Clostridiales bacterium]|nr:phosphoenolpyruvate carboxykinase (GTP) [Clostridiales bacterium]